MIIFLQVFLRTLGVFIVLFALVISTSNGEDLVRELGLDLRNSSLRVFLGVDDSPVDAPIPPAENEQPIWGVVDLDSFFFISMLMMGIVLVSLEIKQYLEIYRNLFLRSPTKIDKQLADLIGRLKKMSDNYYRGGARGLIEGVNIRKMPPVWNLIIQQLELKLPFQDILRVMGNEAGLVRKSFDTQIKTLSSLSNIAPSLGVIGTVLGLVKLLFNLRDPSTLGPNMALALLTTLYGLLLSVLILKPIMFRIENVKEAQMKSFQVAAFWLGLLQDRKPSFYLEQEYLINKKPKN